MTPCLLKLPGGRFPALSMVNLTRGVRTALANPTAVPRLVWRRCAAQFSYTFSPLMNARSFAPESVNMYPTDRCNLKCTMCFQRLRPNHDELPIDTWYAIIDRLARFKPRIHLSGGEPFVYKDIDKLITRIKEHGLFLTVTTNGTFLKEHAGWLVRQRVNRIHLSLDGPRDIHDGIRGVPGTYDLLIAGLRELKAHTKGTLPIVRINSMIDPHNVSAMHEIMRVAEEFNAECVQFLHPLGVDAQALEQHRSVLKKNLGRDLNYWQHADRGCDTTGFSDAWYDELAEFKKTASSRATLFPAFTREQLRAYYTMDKTFYTRMPGRCTAPWQTATILPSGDVESCPDYVIGNCQKDDFLTLWNTQVMRRLRRRIRNHDFFTVCRACCYFYM
jgi:MoaA/NifB/PqqE/SkfB family radical SAM enzyme